MLKKGEVKYGDILWVQFNPSVGHEFQDKRPGLVVQSNKQLANSNLVTLIPLTSNMANKLPFDIVVKANNINNLRSTSILKVCNIISCDFQRMHGKIGEASDEIMNEVKKYLKVHFAL